MPISTFHNVEKPISLEEFMAYVDNNIDLSDLDSVMLAAPMLEALARNKKLLTDEYSKYLKAICDGREGEDGVVYSPSSTILASSKTKPFAVRANLWPSMSDEKKLRSIESSVFSYEIAHNHNFNFMTANYFGPGYETELWEIDDLANMEGVVGESVKLNYLGRTRLHTNKQMFFRRSKDVHLQLPPESLSVSLNLLISDEIDELTDQLFFDLSTSKISGHPKVCIASLRASLLEFAGLLGDLNTADMLVELAHKHPCQRTRAAALSGLIGMLGDGFEPSSAVLGDPSRYVQKVLADAGLD